jgi:D-erythrulose 4-kinase
VLETLREHQDELGTLDAFAGDGDHGVGMVRGAENGLAAARELADQGAGAKTVLARAGEQWSAQAGGTSGALWGAMLAAAGRALGDTDAVDAAAQVRAAREALDALQRIGKAEPDDKTMLDAFIPCVRTLESQVQAGKPIGEAWRKAAEAAESAAQATAPLRPRIGRARPLAERSVGHADAGAVSFAYIVRAIADQMTGGRGRAAPVPVLLNSRRPIMEL